MSSIPELAHIRSELIARFRLDQLPFHQRALRLDELVGLEGRHALVTGGGGSGLGQACCHRLAAMGASVAVFDHDADAAQRVADQVAQQWGANTVALVGSVDSWDDAHRVVDATVQAVGGLDILVNNAGGLFGSQFGPFAALSKRSVDSLIGRNLLGTMFCTHAALEVMIPAGVGRIINIASEGAKAPMRDLGLYNACKAGVVAFTRDLAHEVSELGISTVAVCPGVMMSAGLLQVLQKPDATAAIGTIERGFDMATIGRPALPEEVANVVAFLASEAGAYVHGTAVSVGGGLSD